MESGRGEGKKPKASMDPMASKFIDMMNWNRFLSYRSHVGDDAINDMKEMGNNIRGLVQDALDDVMLECPGLDEGEQNKLAKSLRKTYSTNARRMILKFQQDPDYSE